MTVVTNDDGAAEEARELISRTRPESQSDRLMARSKHAKRKPRAF